MSAAGKWNVTMPTPIGTMKFTWDLNESGGAWQGKMFGQPPVKDSDLRAIRVDGAAVSFETTSQTPMGAIQLAFNGTVKDNAMAGTCKTMYGDQQFTATRA